MKHVLVVEDDAFVRRYVSLLLRNCGFEVKETGSCKEAKEIIKDNEFDLAVIDGLLPDGAGYTITDNIRCKVIFVSGATDQFNRCAMWKRGILYQKPVDASFADCVMGIIQ